MPSETLRDELHGVLGRPTPSETRCPAWADGEHLFEVVRNWRENIGATDWKPDRPTIWPPDTSPNYVTFKLCACGSRVEMAENPTALASPPASTPGDAAVVATPLEAENEGLRAKLALAQHAIRGLEERLRPPICVVAGSTESITPASRTAPGAGTALAMDTTEHAGDPRCASCGFLRSNHSGIAGHIQGHQFVRPGTCGAACCYPGDQQCAGPCDGPPNHHGGCRCPAHSGRSRAAAGTAGEREP